MCKAHNADKSLLAQWLQEHIPRPRTRFAKKAGIDYARLQGYLRGETPPPAALAVIARGLNMSTDDILEDAGVMPVRPVLPAGAVPISGRATAGILAKDCGSPDIRRVSLEIAGLRVTLIVEPL